MFCCISFVFHLYFTLFCVISLRRWWWWWGLIIVRTCVRAPSKSCRVLCHYYCCYGVVVYFFSPPGRDRPWMYLCPCLCSHYFSSCDYCISKRLLFLLLLSPMQSLVPRDRRGELKIKGEINEDALDYDSCCCCYDPSLENLRSASVSSKKQCHHHLQLLRVTAQLRLCATTPNSDGG